MKIGLVLEGGAMRGMYTAGILDRFLEENIVVDEVIGVSAGALFGVNYKSKQKGRAIRYNKKYLNDKNYMGFYSLIKTGNIMNKDFCFNELVNKLDVFDYDTYTYDGDYPSGSANIYGVNYTFKVGDIAESTNKGLIVRYNNE